MKNNIKTLAIGLCFVLLTTGCNTQEAEPVRYITSFDVEKYFEMNFKNYVLDKVGLNDRGRYYQYYRKEIEEGYFALRIAIMPTAEDAYSYAVEGLKQLSWYYQLIENMPGDHFWGTYNGDTVINTSCVITIDNLMISLSSPPPSNLNMIELAEKLYKDLKNETGEYFTSNDKILVPIIKSVVSQTNSVRIGEETLITIDANDPNGGKLEYFISEPMKKSTSGKANEHIFKPSDFSEKQNGKYTFRVRVMNESNIYSKPYEFSIKSDD
jgi:hypothetical protein